MKSTSARRRPIWLSDVVKRSKASDNGEEFIAKLSPSSEGKLRLHSRS